MKLFVVGYMASGKTTFGKVLADKLNLPFIDLDQFIETNRGMTITELFREKGEAEFRKIESEMLRLASGGDSSVVVACGGGTPCHDGNMQFMNETGITVFLETSTPVLISRLQEANGQRPLLAGKSNDEIQEKVLTQLCERLPHYMEAKLKWHGDDLNSEEEIKSNVENFVTSYPSIFR